MATEATLNARLDTTLKKSGNAVLNREGISFSTAVRKLYSWMDENQAVPDWMKDEPADKFQKRRDGMRGMLGIVQVPDGYDVEDLRAARLSKYGEE